MCKKWQRDFVWLQIQGDPTKAEEALRWRDLVSKEKQFHCRGLRTARAMALPPTLDVGLQRDWKGTSLLTGGASPAQGMPGPSRGQ